MSETRDWNELVQGGHVTPEGIELGITDEDLVGGQLTPEATAKLEAAAPAFDVDTAKKDELVKFAKANGIDSSGKVDDLRARIKAAA